MNSVKFVSFSDVTDEVRDRVGEEKPSLNVYGVDKTIGLTNSPRYQSRNLQKYKVIEKGMFAYNPMRLNIGSIGFCHNKLSKGLVSPDYVVFKTNEKSLIPEFFHYHTKSKSWLDWVSHAGEGSVRERIYYSKLSMYKFKLPNLAYQSKAVQILSTINNKIENNRRMNEPLEEMARAIFKSRFVDFDPVHAKAAGNTPAHMDAETATLFPSSFGDDGLPEGWNLYSLREVTEKITKGTTPSKKDLNEAKTELSAINFLKVNNISIDGYFNQKSFEKIPLSIHNGQLKRSMLEKGDVLYSIAGTIGRVIVVGEEILPANTNQALAILRPKSGLCPTGYLHLILKDDKFQAELNSTIVQGVQANLSLSMISAQTFVFPPAEIINQIFSSINSLLTMQSSNFNENQTLAELRDTLLPKLMSGEIRVKDVEPAVEAAV